MAPVSGACVMGLTLSFDTSRQYLNFFSRQIIYIYLRSASRDLQTSAVLESSNGD